MPFASRSLLVATASGMVTVGRKLASPLRTFAKALAALGTMAGILYGGYLGAQHVLASPRFALREVRVSPTTHVSRGDVLTLAQVDEGARLLAIDTDAVAARITTHPWVQSVRVRRQLPSALQIDVVERKAAAAVVLGGLYLVDEAGRPFKRASMDELDGLPVLTGIDRERFVAAPDVSAAAFRAALTILTDYRAGANRPPLSELNIDPRHGFTLYLLDGGAEIRLGRGDYSKKLAWLDRILEAVTAGAVRDGALRVVHLDGAVGDRVRIPVRLAKSQGENQ